MSYRTADLYRPDADDQVDIRSRTCYTGESVDMIICSHVFKRVSDDCKAMRELHRVLKPGGFLIAMVPLTEGVHDTHEDPAITDPAVRWKYFGKATICASTVGAIFWGD